MWRSPWDSLKLFTVGQYSGLQGMAFPSPKDTYPSKDDVASYLQSYVSAFDLPVKLNAKVTALTEREGTYLVRAADEGFTADQVVVATGPFQVPFVPPITRDLDDTPFQIHSADYRNPGQLPDGDVLVVGGGTPVFRSLKKSERRGRSPSPSASAFPPCPSVSLAKTSSGGCRGRVHEGEHRFATRSEVGDTRRAHRIEPEGTSPLRRDPEEAADESRGAARSLRRWKRARHRRDHLGDGISIRLLVDRDPWDQERGWLHRP